MSTEYYGVRRVGDNEEAYIAHIGREKGWKLPGAKYIARFITDTGYKYIYTPAQLAAAKAGKAISDTTGLTARKKRDQAQRGYTMARKSQSVGLRNASNRLKSAKSAYNKTLLGRAEAAGNKLSGIIKGAKSTAEKAASGALKKADSAVRSVRNSVTSYKAKNSAIKKAKSTRAYTTNKDFQRVANRQLETAMRQYANSGLGRAEARAKTTAKNVRNSTANAIDRAERATGVKAYKAKNKAVKNAVNAKRNTVYLGGKKARLNGEAIANKRAETAARQFNATPLGKAASLDRKTVTVLRNASNATAKTTKKVVRKANSVSKSGQLKAGKARVVPGLRQLDNVAGLTQSGAQVKKANAQRKYVRDSLREFNERRRKRGKGRGGSF